MMKKSKKTELDYRNCIKCFRNAISNTPFEEKYRVRTARAFCSLGICYLQLAKKNGPGKYYFEAMKCFSRSVELDSANPVYFYKRAMCLSYLANRVENTQNLFFRRCIEDLNTCMSKGVSCQIERAICLLERRNELKKEDLKSIATDISDYVSGHHSPPTFELIFALGVVHYSLGMYSQALENFNYCDYSKDQENPKNQKFRICDQGAVYTNRAATYYHLGQLEKAVDDYTKADELSQGKNLKAKKYRGMCFEMMGNRVHSANGVCEEMKDLYRKAMKDYSDSNLEARKNALEEHWDVLEGRSVLKEKNSKRLWIEVDDGIIGVKKFSGYLSFFWKNRSCAGKKRKRRVLEMKSVGDEEEFNRVTKKRKVD